MDYTFANRICGLKPSAIREIFKYAADPTVVSLSAGNPAPDAFPAEALREISEKLMKENPVLALQYGVTEGYAPLRESLKVYMKEDYNIGRNFDDLVITSGAQQVMDLMTKALVNEGDEVVCEAPSFIGSLNTFRSYGAKLLGVPMDDDGMNMEALEETLRTHHKIRFIYTIPTFQNPSGITMSLQKRKRLYELAKQYNVLILEDNPYGELRYRGETLPTIKSMDEDGIVIYAGSFSKVISPGMRVGWFVAPKEVAQKLIVCKQGSDVHTNMWSQVLCHEFMTKYDFKGHLQYLRDLYSKKAEYTMDLLKKNLKDKIRFGEIDGGLFIWCTLPEDVDMPTFCLDAVKAKVCVVPGTAFLTDESEVSHNFRINFSTPTDEQLKKGIEILGTLAEKL
ncbi:MAG: PLP-dependent aminotransferase family protein [Ruminococcaceae bacterium]|nr:PLP-dependent aminotransferase family protein [Oscillospiraceae bacterium]